MKEIIHKFDSYLVERSLRFDAVIIGGAALIFMGLTSRFTKDIDCLDPVLPEEIKQAAQDFRNENSTLHLWENWLNNGPISLTEDLPDGWEERLIPLYSGKAIVLRTLGRQDLLMTKLFALCDRELDIADCIALSPTAEELDHCLGWLFERDGNQYWPDHVRKSLKKLAKELGYDYQPAC
ncbi:MAG: hypothetical protein LIQ31_12075 [Planctomycetes bacterium]|nr:hypothetical protein [Planctomycetota bacterium]